MSYWGELNRIVSVARLRAVTGLAVIDRETFASISGGPEDPGVWLIVRSEQERLEATRAMKFITAQVRDLLQVHGWPEGPAQTAIVNVASQESIDAAGGRRNFFS